MAVEGSWKAVPFPVCSSISQANPSPAPAPVFLAAFQSFRGLWGLRGGVGSFSGGICTKVTFELDLKGKELIRWEVEQGSPGGGTPMQSRGEWP